MQKLYPKAKKKKKSVIDTAIYSNDKLRSIDGLTHTQTHIGMQPIVWRPAGVIAEVLHLPALLMLFLLMSLIYTAYCSFWLESLTLFMYFSKLQIISHAMGIGSYAKLRFLYIPTKPNANLLKHIYWKIKAVCL